MVDFGFGCDPILPPLFCPIAIWDPKNKTGLFWQMFFYSELLHSNIFNTTENQLEQPICACDPATVGSKFARNRSHAKKQKWGYQQVFSCFAKGDTC